MEQKIQNLFIICISVRFLLAIIVNYLQKISFMVPILSAILIITSLLFFVKFMNYNKGDVGAFNTNVWWNNFRVVHSVTYLLAGLLILNGNTRKYTPLILLLDVVLGIIFFSYFRN